MSAINWRSAPAPQDGSEFWAYLQSVGLMRLRYWTAEQIAADEGGDPDDYQPGYYDSEENEWAPKWWLPIEEFNTPDND